MAGTNLGTAWIQIKPSMKGMTSSIRSELSGVGESEGGNVGSKFSTGFAAKMGAVAGITSKIFSKITSVVSGSFNAAISRADTLNNFSNVMSNLNISQEASQASIDKLADKLTGLPTTLDSAANAVQRFTTANSDINKSTDMFLALNNALLAGGAGTEIQASAMEQLSQAYAKGKPDMVEWRSVLQAMPAQAKQLADALGYIGTEDLGEALRTGALSMDDFMEKVMELNTEGVNGFKSFEEQAKAATDTIQTKMANVQASLTKVVTAALNGDDMSAPIQQLAERVTEIAPILIQGFTQGFLGVAQALPQMIPPILESLLAQAPALIQGVSQLLISLVTMLPQLIPIITNALPEIIVAIVNFFTSPEAIEAIFNAAIQLFMGLVMAIPQILSALFSAFGSLFGNLWNLLKEKFGKFASDFGNFIGGIFKNAINAVIGFIENFLNGPIDIINGFLDIINGAFGWLGVNIGKITRISLPRLYTGGIVQGIGTDTSDSNLYALSRGEYVIRATAAREIGYENLERMNATGEISGGQTNYFTINGYNKSPEELANIISRKIAFNTRGVMG